MALMASGMGAGQTVALKYSREFEEEADMAGVATTQKAGYSGLGSAEFLRKIMTKDEKDVPQYLLTHPYSSERVLKIEERAARPARTTVDDSLFPFPGPPRHRREPLSPQKEEVWLNRYRKNPKNPVAAYAAALILTIKGDNHGAFDLLSSIDFPYRPLFLGEFYVNANRYKEAVEVLSGQSHPIARFYLAKAYEGQGDLAMAGQVYQELIPYAPSYPEIYQRIAMMLGRQGDEAGATGFSAAIPRNRERRSGQDESGEGDREIRDQLTGVRGASEAPRYDQWPGAEEEHGARQGLYRLHFPIPDTIKSMTIDGEEKACRSPFWR